MPKARKYITGLECSILCLIGSHLEYARKDRAKIMARLEKEAAQKGPSVAISVAKALFGDSGVSVKAKKNAKEFRSSTTWKPKPKQKTMADLERENETLKLRVQELERQLSEPPHHSMRSMTWDEPSR